MSKIYIQLATYPPKNYHTIPAHPSQQNFKKKKREEMPSARIERAIYHQLVF
jgi:hypothetical protein